MLSHAGREVMIKSVVQVIPSFAMACFLLPQKFCDKLVSYVSNFWWGGDAESKGVHWINWNHLSLPKAQGGMGFRDFRAFNLAILAKQGWRLLKHPNSFCAKMMKGIYYPTSDFLHARKGSQSSWAWASLMEGKEVLLQGVRWQIQMGKR